MKPSMGERFDEGIFCDEMRMLRRRMSEEGFYDFEVENDNKYETVDREGKKVMILVYKRVLDDISYLRDGWFLYAVQNKKLVGYLGGYIETYPVEDGFVSTGKTSFSVVSKKGNGVGGAMEKINGYLMQKSANENGDLVREVTDGNMNILEMKLVRGATKEEVKEMLVSRQLWLELYGPHGKGGFEWKNGFEKVKVYKQGDELPNLGMKETKNNIPIGNMSRLVRKW